MPTTGAIWAEDERVQYVLLWRRQPSEPPSETPRASGDQGSTSSRVSKTSKEKQEKPEEKEEPVEWLHSDPPEFLHPGEPCCR